MKKSPIKNHVRAASKEEENACHVYVYGDIYNDQSEFGKEWGVVSMTSVLQQMKAKPDAETIIVHIHSRGGDVTEGFAIHDLLATSGKKIITITEGLCASIATVIALAGSVRKMTKNSEFFIHNPWADPFNMDGFTADDYEKRAEEIRVAENKLRDFYAEKTGAEKEVLSELMKVETTMTADKALELKFITEIVETVSAFARIGKSQNQNKNEMTKVARAISFLDGLKAFLNGESKSAPTLAMKMTLKDGTEIDVNTEADDVAVGDEVTVNGEPVADGEHELSDGRMMVTAGGKVTEIKPAEAEGNEGEDSAEAEALRAQIATLTQENATLKTQNADLSKNMNDLMARVSDVEKMARKTTSNFAPEGRDFTKDRNNKAAEDTVEARVARRKAEMEAAKKAKV